MTAASPVRFLLLGALPLSLVNFRGPLLRALRDAGCEVHAAAAAIEDDAAIAEALRDMGVEAHSVPIARAGLNPVADLKALIALVRLMRRIRPTIVLGYTIKPVVWGTLAAWIAGVPRRYAMITGLGYAFTGESTGKRGLVQKVARALYRTALSRVHGVFFQNPDDLALFRSLGLLSPDTPVTIVNGSGVDLSHYSARPMPAGPPRFLMIARLLGDKGVREYAAAAAMVRQTHPEASFHLVGGLDPNPDAIDEAEVARWIEEEHVVWHGAQADVRPFLAEAHVFVLPSYREGTPRTVLEAMATGRAIITTDAPGCRETVTDGDNGFLVPPRSADALAAAMLRFLAEPKLIDDMAARSLDLVRNKYAAEKVTAAMLDAMGVRGGNGGMKRLIDIVGAFTALLLLSPVIALAAIAVRLRMGSPVLFSQQRPGRDARPFRMYKFRTMLDTRDADGQLLSDGERLTPLGQFLRSSSIDELPGLWSVLKGDMSLVGPRPLLMSYIPLYSAEQARRHEVRPGVTGWAQVMGRNSLSWEQKFALDVWYVDNRSLLLDLRILLLTLLKVVRRDGISAAGEATMPVFQGSPRDDG